MAEREPRWRKGLPVYAKNALRRAEEGERHWRTRADESDGRLGAALDELHKANAIIKHQNRTIQAVAKALIAHLPRRKSPSGDGGKDG